MKIGNLNVKNSAALAPMAGVTDLAFRELCAKNMAAFVVSEMISSMALTHADKKTIKLLENKKLSCPYGIQLFGSDPEVMAKAAKIVLNFNPDFIDINMGCPAPKITSSGAGSALMQKPELCGKIVKAVCSESSVPVSVKIRKGWDNKNLNAVQIAKICEENGASFITIHGKTRAQMYKPIVDLNIIKEVKEAVKIPVIGNGDIKSAEDAAIMKEKTGCDLVMVGRASLGNPWIFREISAYFTASKIIPEAKINERILTMKNHVEAICKYKGEKVGMLQARKHIAWYLKGFKNAAAFRLKACSIENLKDFEKFLIEIFKQIN